ncbi:nuclear transport factor 2 family protein [Flavobacterium sedimenticola]|uniref:Nuclear transport factor 2 family protein n=1 Tax=Flavobacterium sedimenticola TaxID=3043286 RepID=A0ABT6XS65_9FLAO|nr:nuclear transport factor 2 family protein [Flavobacterium sedimenticola]MDI9257901.1 nuclear transport factor 2 family protein [Flavobacterium sedimenticola]
MKQYEQIVECENKLLEAIKTGDIKVLDELLHENLIFNIPTGHTITKEMDIQNYRSGIMTVSEILPSEQIIQITGNISTVAVTVHLKAKYADQVIDGKFRYLRVWQFFDNHWKVIAGSGFQIQ